MEGLSVAANGLAVVSIAVQLTESCIKLYRFWESIEDAPQEIYAMKEDLQYLSSVFGKIDLDQAMLGKCVIEGVRHCRYKVAELVCIAERLDAGLQSNSRKKRAWAALKATAQSKHIQRFRESLTETKSTLALAMLHQCVLQSQAHTITPTVESTMTQALQCTKIRTELNQTLKSCVTSLQAGSNAHRFNAGRLHNDCTEKLSRNPLDAEVVVTLSSSRQIADRRSPTKYSNRDFSELSTLSRQPSNEDHETQTRTSRYSKGLPCRISHTASVSKIAVGSVWVRSTTIHLDDEQGESTCKSRTVTSTAFYPAAWMQRLGITNGIEALLASGSKSWLYTGRVSLTCAIPEHSSIFELCRTGQTRAVQTLLSKKLGSVMDTSPTGWKPLHFAAAGGHVELCAMLIQEGADKSALVYEGPAPNVLSPIALFAASPGDYHAETKILMLRMFSDCIEIANPDDEGWTVHEWLKRSYARERVPITRNSVSWLLQLTAKEEFVMFGGRTVWFAIQHALRSTLLHARSDRCLDKILGLSERKLDRVSRARLDSLSLYLALRINEKGVLSMVPPACSFLQLKGFDEFTDEISQRDFLRAFPNSYSTWCYTLLDSVERAEEHIKVELQLCETMLGMDRETLINGILQAKPSAGMDFDDTIPRQMCSRCYEDYSAIGFGLISPTAIATHGRDYLESGSHLYSRYSNLLEEDSDEDDDDDEYFDAESYQGDMSLGTGVMLYNAHGKIWLGQYEDPETLCATCFFLEEQYISEDSRGTDFPPMPETFEGKRVLQQFMVPCVTPQDNWNQTQT